MNFYFVSQGAKLGTNTIEQGSNLFWVSDDEDKNELCAAFSLKSERQKLQHL